MTSDRKMAIVFFSAVLLVASSIMVVPRLILRGSFKESFAHLAPTYSQKVATLENHEVFLLEFNRSSLVKSTEVLTERRVYEFLLAVVDKKFVKKEIFIFRDEYNQAYLFDPTLEELDQAMLAQYTYFTVNSNVLMNHYRK